MILDALAQVLQNFGSVELWLFIISGIIIGLIFGLVPGLTGMVALALILPFAFALTPEQALPLMVAILSVQFMGGSITAILLNVPGTPGNAATLIDGFPMTQKGEAGRALGAALTSSGVGSIFCAVVALAMIPLLLPMVMALRTADMVFIILMGITFIAVLGAGSMVKGLISGGVGLLLSFVGFFTGLAVPRFTFGSLYLYDGIPLIPLALGLFAVPEMIVLASRGGTIAGTQVTFRGMRDVWQGMKDVAHHWLLCLRSSIIGFIVGAIPGVGASVATFVAYGQARQTSKHPERFGTGTVEGVIAPESANDAKEGGSLLTTLALGIPGSAPGALLLGTFIILGLVPGPGMLTEHLDLSLTLLLIILVASVIGAAICLPLAAQLAKIALIPGRVLVPLVLVIVFIGVFAYQRLIYDVIMALIFGVVGLLMRTFGYNRPALILGFILGSLFEKYLFIAFKVDGPLFFMRPVSLALIFIMIATFSFEPIKRALQRRRGVNKA